jgi:hypothetical protein
MQYDFQDISRDPRVDELVDQIVNEKVMKDRNWIKAKTPEEKKIIEEQYAEDFATQGGVNYLKKMIEKSKGNLLHAFARYRGQGEAAKYHGRHVMELYQALKKNPDIKRLVEENGGGPQIFVPPVSGTILPANNRYSIRGAE